MHMRILERFRKRIVRSVIFVGESSDLDSNEYSRSLWQICTDSEEAKMYICLGLCEWDIAIKIMYVYVLVGTAWNENLWFV